MRDPNSSPVPLLERMVPPEPTAPGDRAARREFQRRVLRATLTVNAVVLCTLIAALLAWKMRTLLLLFVIALFFTLLLHPLVRMLERRGVRRGLATGVVFVLGVVSVGTVLFVILSPLVSGAEHLATQLPKIISQAEKGKGQVGKWLRKLDLEKYVAAKHGGAQSIISRFSKPALSIGRGVLSGAVGLFTIFFLTFFLLIHAPGIYRGILEWMQPATSERVRSVVADVERSVVGYVAGDFATSLIAGGVITATLIIMGVPYPLVLGIWVALVDFLPLIGGLLAGVPTVIIAALHSIPAGIVTLVIFLLYQEIENHVLYPIIMSRTVKLNSLWVIVSVLIGAELGDIVGSIFGGFVGALIAVPAGSAVQVVARDIWSHRRTSILIERSPAAAAAAAAAAGGPGRTGLETDGATGLSGEPPALVASTRQTGVDEIPPFG